MSSPSEFRPTWAAVDTSAFSRNIDAIERGLPDRSRLIAVLKANAYGHGANVLAWICEAKKVAMIGVALLEEAIALRGVGITVPILVFGPLGIRGIQAALDNRITIGVSGPEELAAACDVARDRDVRIHLKFDTGMGRLGLVEGDLQLAAEMIRASPRLTVEAVYTHFASADDDEMLTRHQIENFDRMRTVIDAPLRHLANSAATLRGYVREGEFARVGIALYTGVMRWRTEIVRLKTLPPNHAVGYGATYRTTRESRIATLPVGYADGYDRKLSNNGDVIVHGMRVPIVGRVSMDFVTVDVSALPNARLGDEVVLLGDGITADEIASRIDTIPYEVFCNVSARVPRIYK
jgi:alanine racemase